MDSKELRERTKNLALRIIKLVAALPRNRLSDVLGRQVLKSGTSVGANYREALRASSKKHFVSIIDITVREAEETVYWLELLAESATIKPSRLVDLVDECRQLAAILNATSKTAKRKLTRKPPSTSKSAISNQQS